MGHYLAYVLVPKGTEDIETKVVELMAPFSVGLKVGDYRRECDCLLSSAAKAAKELSEWKVKALTFEFSKEQFSKDGVELGWRRALLSLGNPALDCEECNGSGFTAKHNNPSAKWDYWEIGGGFAEGILRDSVKNSPADANIVPVNDLDLNKIPSPHDVVTPDGRWLSENDFILFSSGVIIDENWEETVRSVLSEHQEATLVVVNCHL